VLGQVKADGSVSMDTALQAFSLAFGPLPGVIMPAGDPGFIQSGTMAMRWLVSYWAKLTPAQRAAAIALVPDLAGLTASALPGGATIAEAVARPGNAPVPAAGGAPKRSDAFYTELAQRLVTEIAGHISPPPPFGLTVSARVGPPQKGTSGMETGVYNASGGMGGAPAKCVIVVAPLGDASSDDQVTMMMAHEVWHCYEGAIVGLARYWSQNPAPWIAEGEADWVGLTLYPGFPSSDRGPWPDYLEKPEAVLFSRAYSAIGFYAHLDEVSIDPWTRLVPILQATTSQAAFTAAGADGDAFLDSWASGYLRDASRGAPWEITGPEVTTNKATPKAIDVNNGGSAGVQVAPYTNEIAVLGQTPDVLSTAFAGHVRLSDDAGHDYLAGDSAEFCLLPTGCACPGSEGDPPPLPLEGGRVAVAATGGAKGATGTLSGMKLDDFCSKLTGSWTGIWQNAPEWGGATGGFTLTIVQKGSSFSGTTEVTGPTCVRHGTVTGTVAGGKVQMGWVAAERTVTFDGTVKGRTMSGTWSAIACKPAIQISGTWSATKD
jgi:hypothetical protein